MKMFRLARFALMGATLFPLGCGGGVTSQLAELPPPTRPDDLMQVSKEEVPYHLPNQEVLQGWFGNPEMPGEMNCDVGPQAFQVRVDGDRLTFDNEESIAERRCDDGTVFSDIRTRVETVYTCEGEDWSEWSAGRAVDTADLGLTSTKLCGTGKGSMAHYISVSFTATMPGNEPASFLGVASIRGENNQGGCGFVADGASRKLAGNCTYSSLSQMKMGGDVGAHFFQAEISSGSAVDMGLGRFVSGAMKSKLNDWDGNISFMKDTLTYKFTRGEEVSEGSFPATSAIRGVSLKDMFSR